MFSFTQPTLAVLGHTENQTVMPQISIVPKEERVEIDRAIADAKAIAEFFDEHLPIGTYIALQETLSHKTHNLLRRIGATKQAVDMLYDLAPASTYDRIKADLNAGLQTATTTAQSHIVCDQAANEVNVIQNAVDRAIRASQANQAYEQNLEAAE
jgi:hypothetical protein